MVKRVFLIVAVFMAIGVSAAKADWISAHEKEITALEQAKDCKGLWNLFWPEVKKGNLQARYMLMRQVYSPFKNERMSLPGHDDSLVDTGRDSLTLAVYSLGMQNDSKYETKDRNWRKAVFNFAIQREDHPLFFECYETKNSAECTKLAADQKIVPSFDAWVKEIDRYVDMEAEPVCK